MNALWTSLFGSGAAVAAVIVLGRKLIDGLLSKDLARFKIQMELTAQRELERLRTGLQREATEHQIRFTRVHERQAEVIAQVFGGLQRLHDAFVHWMNPVKIGNPNMFQLGQDAHEAFNDFLAIYYPQAIWLDPDTCNAINRIIGTLNMSYWEFTREVDDQGYPIDMNRWTRAYDKLSQEIPVARRMLDERFRQILGVVTPTAVLSESKGLGDG